MRLKVNAYRQCATNKPSTQNLCFNQSDANCCPSQGTELKVSYLNCSTAPNYVHRLGLLRFMLSCISRHLHKYSPPPEFTFFCAMPPKIFILRRFRQDLDNCETSFLCQLHHIKSRRRATQTGAGVCGACRS